MRRVISMMSLSLNSAGALRSALSRKIVTSAELRSGRVLVPEKITSSMAAARMLLCELSPITHRSASSRLDLPQPLGPTTPVNPGGMTSSVGSTNDLKPRSLRREIFIAFLSKRRGEEPALSPNFGPLLVRRPGCRGGSPRDQRIDHRADVLDRELFLHELAPDEEVRSADDAELAPALLHPIEPVDHGLILAAGVKLLTRHPHLRGDLVDWVEA